MPLTICEVNLELTWSRDCVSTSSTGAEKFQITETKFYVPVATLSTQVMRNYFNNENLLLKEQLTGINMNPV